MSEAPAALTFVSAFAGIGGFELGLERAGWTCVGQIENDPFCEKVLRWRWPHVRRWGDITTVRGDDIKAHAPQIDLLCGGFPCQDLSVAGRRAGLDGARSGLFFEFLRLARELRPRWVLVENVPGLLSSPRDWPGEDLAIVLAELGDAGYFVERRVLDSRWFGVPQRRRRVFLVGHLGGPPPRSVLFESDRGAGDPPAIAEAGQEVAGTLGLGSPSARGRRSTDLDGHGAYVVSKTLRGGHHGTDDDDRSTFVVSPTLGTHTRPGNEGNDDGVIVSAPVTSKWRKGTGGPSGDEAQNLVVTDTAATLANAHPRAGRARTDDVNLVFVGAIARDRGGALRADSTPSLTKDSDKGDNVPLVLRVSGNDYSTGRDLAPALQTDGDQGSGPVVFRKSKRAADNEDDETWVEDDYANTLNTFDGGETRSVELVADPREDGIRRLTPTECERLQGFPDGWTAPDGPGLYIPKWAFRVKPNRHDRRRGIRRMRLAARGRRARALVGWRCIRGTPDGPRVSALGNAVSVPVAAWVGRQIAAASV